MELNAVALSAQHANRLIAPRKKSQAGASSPFCPSFQKILPHRLIDRPMCRLNLLVGLVFLSQLIEVKFFKFLGFCYVFLKCYFFFKPFNSIDLQR